MTTVQKYAKDNGLKIVDSKSDMTVEVSSADVRKSKAKEHDACVLAQACKRNNPGFKKVFVFRSVAYALKNKQLLRFATTASTKRAIDIFDPTHQFAPGTYTFTAPRIGHKRGERKKRADNKRGRHDAVKSKGTHRVRVEMEGVRSPFLTNAVSAKKAKSRTGVWEETQTRVSRKTRSANAKLEAEISADVVSKQRAAARSAAAKKAVRTRKKNAAA